MNLEKLFLEKAPLFVFSSTRRLKHFYLEQGEGFLPNAMSMGSFFEQAFYIPNQKKIPKSVRQILMIDTIKAIAKEKKSVLEGLLLFENSFLGYLESTSFLFDLFDELSSACIKLNELSFKDIYLDYEKHLEVLEMIYDRYVKKLEELGFYDKIMQKKPTILKEFFEHFSSIEWHLDGFMSVFERQCLLEVAELVPITLHLSCDKYNQKFLEFLNLKLETDCDYSIDFKTQKILSQTFNDQKIEPKLYANSSYLKQGALVLQTTEEYLQKDNDPNKMAIITPNADFLPFLKLLDQNNNLNFAMGLGAKNSPYYTELVKILEDLETSDLDLSGSALLDLENITLALLEQQSSKEKAPLKEVHSQIMHQYHLLKDTLKNYSLKDLLHLYLQEFETNFRLDDSSGGKIRVMDTLETRGMQFDKIVVANFNETCVPSLKDCDLFLNSALRKSLNLPTLLDKKNLQKHYYYQLFKNSKEVALSYIESETLKASNMLLELNLHIEPIKDAYTLFETSPIKEYQEEEIKATIPKDFSFSASSLNAFLTCKRRFYYHYIKRFKETPKDENNSAVGSLIHELLKEAYEKDKTPHALEERLIWLLETRENITPKERLDTLVALKKIQAFYKKERERFNTEIIILDLEKSFETIIQGVAFKGRIDRIDKTADNEIILLDYKFKSDLKLDNMSKTQRGGLSPIEIAQISTDYQMATYAHALKNLGYKEPIKAFFYDLRKGELLEEDELVLQAKMDHLEFSLIPKLKQEIDFEKTLEVKDCEYCSFKDMCNR
ncbi:PD-(D/E)XK nuclease family protein [Helicobacter pylori]|uniref:ATP-dependent deoxyribonuclease AddB n=1 Tax=Helicobacter pylori TaxID=210 RepID=UPI001932B858|nr:PD-(D/E)XK nuclease family protein [Helicobacter pylori]MBM0603721.1 ATP-dependent deoxyribonuclease AddB [Helicobacter pylori]MBM0614307.1 ATP-dependent deoxyribonuclease AddB [Helicobacter pylori]MBM0615683.1 ATP-dependent deoxyribonuclease AddB [Helicobacter pylori]MBM0617036.1 ATP-dependent deoxyribonuclease AddB [Helicobacter pylori]MBM0628944.1 ATP-dependent deoxyribonuclease AddB [Helicobacter pylori]